MASLAHPFADTSLVTPFLFLILGLGHSGVDRQKVHIMESLGYDILKFLKPFPKAVSLNKAKSIRG